MKRTESPAKVGKAAVKKRASTTAPSRRRAPVRRSTALARLIVEHVRRVVVAVIREQRQMIADEIAALMT